MHMIATMDAISLLDKAEGVADVIAESDVAEDYREKKQALANNKEAQDIIRRFVKLKEKYDEVQRFGKYHPDYKTTIKAMMDLKRELDLNETISAYKKAEDALETLLNEVSALIAGAVSPSIKVPNGDPFFDRGCGGGCGTGGACQCG